MANRVPGPSGWLGRLPSHTRRVLGPVLLAKAATLAIVALVALAYPTGFDLAAYVGVFRGNHGHRPDLLPGADVVFRTWDAEHYLELAAAGYGGDGPKNGFFPLYPLLIRGLTLVVGGHALIAALVASLVLGTVGLLVLHHWVATRRGARIADAMLLLLCCQPGAFFTCLPYSEALFLCLVAGVFLALERDRMDWAGALGALLALTRPVGVLIAAPMAWRALTGQRRVRAVSWSLLPLAGWGAYFVLLAVQTGDPWIGFRIQRQFIAAPSVGRLLDPLGFVHTLVTLRSLHGFVGSALDRASFLWFLVPSLALLFERRPLRERHVAIYAWLLGLVPAVTMSLMAFTRYVSLDFPVQLKTAEWLVERRRSLYAVSLLLAGVQVWLLLRHVTHRWAG